MNDFLADLMRFGNGVIATVYILGVPIMLMVVFALGEISVSWFLIYLVGSIVFATVTFGALATFISIRTELIQIRELLESKPSPIQEDFLKDFQG